MTTPHSLAAAVLAAGLALAACAGVDDGTAPADPAVDPTPAPDAPAATDTPSAAAAAEVTIRTFSFEPDPLTVSAGTTVEFTNLDSTTHTVTAGTRDQPEGDVIDASLGQGDTATWVLDTPGTYQYFCRLHSGPGMEGRIVVEA